jgi:hypothetical protein
MPQGYTKRPGRLWNAYRESQVSLGNGVLLLATELFLCVSEGGTGEASLLALRMICPSFHRLHGRRDGLTLALKKTEVLALTLVVGNWESNTHHKGGAIMLPPSLPGLPGTAELDLTLVFSPFLIGLMTVLGLMAFSFVVYAWYSYLINAPLQKAVYPRRFVCPVKQQMVEAKFIAW